MSADRPISKEDVAVLLASALGQEKSYEVVATAARALNITRTGFTGDDVRAIFDALVKAEGLVGVVARFAVSRGDVRKLIAMAPAPDGGAVAARPEPHSRGDARAARSSGSPPAVDIVHLIAPALGVEKAREAIESAAARRGIDLSRGLSHDAALSVLDEMTKVEGIVGVVARFAKARFLLARSD